MILKQKKGLESRVFHLKERSLNVRYKTTKEVESTDVELDKLGHTIVYKADNLSMSKIKVRVLLAISLLIFFYEINQEHSFRWGFHVNVMFVCVIAAIWTILRKKDNDLILTGGMTDIVFFRNKPTELQVDHFVAEVIKASKQYKKEKYSRADLNIPEEQFLSNLLWLKDSEVITTDEFNDMKQEYDLKRLL